MVRTTNEARHPSAVRHTLTPTRRAATGLLAVAVAAAVAGCDTGDGTELRDPAADAPPATDVPIGTPVPDESDGAVSDTVATVPIETAPPSIDPDAPTLPAPGEPAGFELVAPWGDGGVIDPRYGCDDFNASPPLVWNGLPEGTVELAISLVDENDLSRGRPFVHWVMTGIDPELPGLVENEIPAGSTTALNFFGNVAYDGPCPDPGTTGVYRLTLSALNNRLDLADATPAAETLDAIDLAVIDEVTITGSSTR